MSHTPTSSGPQGNAAAPTPAQAAQKPSLTGVRIKQRKGQAKATAKFEPESEYFWWNRSLYLAFRDALLLHLELLPAPTNTETLVAKLVQAGSTLEFLKYSEQLFELLFVGGLLQPGGSYLDEKRSPVYILKDDSLEGPGDSVKGMVEVFKRVIQRYKYLQKPLEENFLPDLLGYLGKWEPSAREKLANATALFIIELQLSPKCLSSLSKDHVVKDGVALDFLTAFCKQYFASKQTIDQLGSAIRRSGLKDIASTIPLQVRNRQYLEDHFKKEGLPQVNEWYAKLALGEVKDQTISNLVALINDEESVPSVSGLISVGLMADFGSFESSTSRETRRRGRSCRLDLAGSDEDH